MGDDDKPEVEFSVKVFEGDIEDTLIQAKIFTDEMIRLFPEFKKQQVVQAKMVKAKYDALINAGFNEEQALWMCNAEG
jgi:hypothetical protein